MPEHRLLRDGVELLGLPQHILCLQSGDTALNQIFIGGHYEMLHRVHPNIKKRLGLCAYFLVQVS